MSNTILLVTISIVVLTFVIFVGAAVLPLLDPLPKRRSGQVGEGIDE